MTTKSDSLQEKSLNLRPAPAGRRWLPLLVVAGALLTMALYSLGDRSRLAQDPLLGGADWAGYAVCHRITDRSFSVNGRQLPLCARCTGMYLGVTVTFVVLFLAGRLRRGDLPPLRILLLLVGFIGLMGIDGINSYLHFFPNAPHLYTPRNWLRLATGMGTGLAMGLFVFPALAQTLWREQDYRPPVETLRELGGLILIALLAAVLVLSNQATILYVLALASVAGLLMILTAILTVLLLILLRRDGRAVRRVEAALPLAIGLILALTGISLVSYLRFTLTGTMTGFPGL